MTPKQKEEMYKDIEQHGQNLLAIFPDSREKNPVALCKKLRRYENKATYHTTVYCNTGNQTQLTAANLVIEKVESLLGKCSIEEARLFLNTDPRGYALKVKLPVYEHGAKLLTDWGGYGILAPDFTPNNK